MAKPGNIPSLPHLISQPYNAWQPFLNLASSQGGKENGYFSPCLSHKTCLAWPHLSTKGFPTPFLPGRAAPRLEVCEVLKLPLSALAQAELLNGPLWPVCRCTWNHAPLVFSRVDLKITRHALKYFISEHEQHPSCLTLSSELHSSCQEAAKARLGLLSLACPGPIHMDLAEMQL